MGEVRLSIFQSGEGSVYTLAISGALDLQSAPDLDARLEGYAAMGDIVSIVLDLSGLTYLDSAGLRALALAKRRLRERLRVVGPPPPIVRVFEHAGLNELIE